MSEFYCFISFCQRNESKIQVLGTPNISQWSSYNWSINSTAVTCILIHDLTASLDAVMYDPCTLIRLTTWSQIIDYHLQMRLFNINDNSNTCLMKIKVIERCSKLLRITQTHFKNIYYLSFYILQVTLLIMGVFHEWDMSWEHDLNLRTSSWQGEL